MNCPRDEFPNTMNFWDEVRKNRKLIHFQYYKMTMNSFIFTFRTDNVLILDKFHADFFYLRELAF